MYDIQRLGGKPIHVQYEMPEMSPLMGTPHTGKFPGKMLWVHHTHDASLWPSDGVGMRNNVEREVGYEEGRKHFRLRFTHNAEHTPPSTLPPAFGRAPNTTLIDYLRTDRAEPRRSRHLGRDRLSNPPRPPSSSSTARSSCPTPPRNAAASKPVVSVTANGEVRAEVRAGEPVTFQAHAELPDGAGSLIAAQWDFDGSGTYPEQVQLDGISTSVDLETTHAFDRPGTYFVTALVESHRDGDVNATSRRIPNLASARVVVS